MGVKPGYKQTDVGVIPEDWEVVSIGKAGQVLGGRQRSPHNVGEPCKYLRVANVFDGFLETEDVFEMPFTTAEKERFLLRHGDILLNEGQSIDLVGRSAIYRGIPDQCCFQNTLIRFRANRNTCVEFAQLVFQQYLRLGVFASIALQTTSIAHLGSGRFAALKMPQPPHPQQKTHSRGFSKADELIECLERLIAKKRLLKRGVMQELLTGKNRLPGYSGEWEMKRFGEIAQLRNERIDPRRTGVQEFCIELEHIEQGTGRLAGYTTTGEGSSLKSVFQNGDVLFGKLRAYMRKYWLADREGVCSTEIWVLVANHSLLIPEFLFQLVKVDRFIEVASTAYGTQYASFRLARREKLRSATSLDSGTNCHRRHPLSNGRRDRLAGSPACQIPPDQAGPDAKPFDREDSIGMKEDRRVE
jgi:type I restriction enzyme S subunit